MSFLRAAGGLLAAGCLLSPLLQVRAHSRPGRIPYREGRVLVAFHEQAAPAARLRVLSRFGLTVEPGRPNRHMVRLRTRRPAAETVLALRRDPAVRVAEPDYIVSARGLPNDPRFGEQWYHRNFGQFAGTPGIDLGTPGAWDVTTGSDQVVVAVIDTGVDYTHPDLSANILREPGGAVVGYDFVNEDPDPMDDQGHGTHLAGIIGAVGSNGFGISGVCQTVRIMPLKFLDSSGFGTISDAIRAIDFATERGVPISNNSWGGPEESQLLLEAIQRARAGNQLFVTAAGNGGPDFIGDDNDQVPDYPGNFRTVADNVVNVAATDDRDRLAQFSNFGLNTVDLGAPGVGILSSIPGGIFTYLNGTSMAAPMFAGSAALLRAHTGPTTYLELKQQLLSAVRPAPSLQGKTVTGGSLDLRGVFPSIVLTRPIGGEVWPVGTQQEVRWSTGGLPAGATVRVELTRADGGPAEVLTEAVPNTGVFTWTVTAPASLTCRVRVSVNGTGLAPAESPGHFEIREGAAFSWIYPEGGESLFLGQPATLRWQSVGITGPVALERRAGAEWVTLAASTENDGEETVVLHPPAGDSGFRVRSLASPEVAAETGTVTLVQPTVAVTAPNGGEVWRKTRLEAITWTGSTLGTGTVRIELSRNGGKKWRPIVEQTQNDGSFNYTVTGKLTNKALVRVIWLPDPEVTDRSDRRFRIKKKGK